MGNRGVVDLAELKARNARSEQAAADQRLIAWARALERWFEEPLEAGQEDSRTIKVALSGQTLVLTKRLAPDVP